MKHLIVTTLLSLLLLSCSEDKSSSSLKVLTVSIEPQAELLRALVGNRMEVRTFLSRGADPENFDPSVADLRSLTQSRAYFITGCNTFETVAAERIGSNGNVEIIDCSEGIEPITGTHTHHHDEAHEHQSHESTTDPHITNSLINLRAMAGTMLQALKRIDPEGADFYTARHDSIVHRLDSINNSWRQILANVPSRSFVMWHPALSYLARDYGLTQLSIAADGKETSIKTTAALMDLAKKNNARVAFVQPTDGNAPQTILANIPQLKVVEINTLEPGIIDQLQKVITSLAN